MAGEWVGPINMWPRNGPPRTPAVLVAETDLEIGNVLPAANDISGKSTPFDPFLFADFLEQLSAMKYAKTDKCPP